MRQGNNGNHFENSFKFEIEGLVQLFSEVIAEGFQLVGPTVRDGAVVYDSLTEIQDLPQGFEDEQSPGVYRLRKGKEKEYFGYAVGPQSWKKFLHPPAERIGVYNRSINGADHENPAEDLKPLAFLGVRPCELRAIEIQDRVFLNGPYIDSTYRANREKLFIIAVNCTHPSGTCFCTSMGTGPQAGSGFDLCLTEVSSKKKHFFLIQIGSESGERLLDRIPREPATSEDIALALDALKKAELRIKAKLETEDLPNILNRNFDHPRWEETGKRCLSCGNCTLVCPTCFCSTVEEVTDLSGETAERWKRWDSCFTADFSYIHGGSVRQSTKSRYRQWMTHKLSNWMEQFGMMGCVGCGRCLTWCPVGIDITEEATYIREHDLTQKPKLRKGDKTNENH